MGERGRERGNYPSCCSSHIEHLKSLHRFLIYAAHRAHLHHPLRRTARQHGSARLHGNLTRHGTLREPRQADRQADRRQVT